MRYYVYYTYTSREYEWIKNNYVWWQSVATILRLQLQVHLKMFTIPDDIRLAVAKDQRD